MRLRRGHPPEISILHARRALFLVCTLIHVHRTVSQDPCFETIGSLNNVMQTELVRIQNGATPQDAYMYNLCNNTFFDSTTSILQPVLNNVMFICGDDGNRLGRCVIVGGSIQVQIVDSSVDSYPLQELSFMGITFSSFESNALRTGTSIGAFASSITTATFIDCTWQEFTSDFVIRQNATSASVGSMTIEIERGILTGGSSGVIFDNNAGLLRINDIDVTDVTAAAFLATANNGASFLSGMRMSLTDVNSVTFTTAGGSQSVTNSTLTQMTRIADAFFVEDEGSTLLLEQVFVVRNQIQANSWNAVAVRAGAIAQISTITIAENTGFEFGIVSFSSLVTVQDTIIRQNTGSESTGTVSAPIFAITDAQVVLNQVQLVDNTDFSASVVALIRSTVTINRSCFQGGSSEFVVFVANDATFMVSENYVADFVSARCQATGPRLFQENDASGCFLGSSTCEGTCLVLADQTSCLAYDTIPTPPVSTSPPTMVPIRTPTLSAAPSASPLRLETIMPSMTPIKNETLAPMENKTLAPIGTSPTRSPTQSPVQLPVTPSPDGLTPTNRPSSEPTAIPSRSIKPSASIVPSASSIPSFVPIYVETQKPSECSMKGMGMGKGMGMDTSKGKGKGKGKEKEEGKSMEMGKGSNLDDECEEHGKGSKQGKGKGGKGGGKRGKGKGVGKGKGKGKGGKGLEFVPEYEELWSSSMSASPSHSPPRGHHGKDGKSFHFGTALSRFAGYNYTQHSTTSAISDSVNSTNVTDTVEEDYRNNFSDAKLIPDDELVR